MSINNKNKANPSEILLEELADNGVLRLTLNDAKRRNALSEEMMTKLATALTSASENEDIRTIILAGNGPAFCSGHDLKQMSAARKNRRRWARLLFKGVFILFGSHANDC